jgi:dinuclear metal center YbgI/SA1388 family protein
MPTVADVVAHLDAFAPPHTAAEWDNVGLLLGDGADPADRILLCLTVTADVVAEAVADGVRMIVTHHPVLFRGAKRLTASTADGKLLLPLLRAGVAVYSPHTAFDNCPGGINDGLCRRLGVTEGVRPLRPRDGGRECKIAVFVPESDLAKVSDALFAAGAGVIGRYTECSFRLHGTGTFHGGEGTNPTVGKAGRREEAAEWRLEVLVPQNRVDAAVEAIRRSHSYEEPAFDVYPLGTTKSGGEGRVGGLAKPTTLGELAATAKAALGAAAVQVVGEPGKVVKTVAVACGAAGEFLSDAGRAGADVFVTGEVRFHDALAAEAAGVGLVLPGHYPTERPGVEDLAGRLAGAFPDAAVWASRRERDPLRAV